MKMRTCVEEAQRTDGIVERESLARDRVALVLAAALFSRAARGARRASREQARGCGAAGIVSENHRARTLDGGKRA